MLSDLSICAIILLNKNTIFIHYKQNNNEQISCFDEFKLHLWSLIRQRKETEELYNATYR